MALSDRDYYQERPSGLAIHARSVVVILVVVNIAVWLIQVALVHSRFSLEQYLACTPVDVFLRGQVWRLLTASFLHAPQRIGHLLGNMLFLFFFGRELETIYGRRDFLIFYLAAATISILAEAAYQYGFGERGATIYGASGAVMASVVLFTLFYPQREIYLAFFIPIQAWLLCAIFVLLDLLGALGGSTGDTRVAFFAHLTGAAFGLLYRFLDLRSQSVRSWFRPLLRRLTRRSRGPRLLRPRRPAAEGRRVETAAGSREEPDPVSARIDQILEKISRSGRESLTSEELEYLQRNSKRYRSGS